MRRLLLLLFTISIGLVSDAFCQEDAAAKRMTATIAGKVIWAGHDLSHTSVSSLSG